MNISIMRAFVQMRQLLENNKKLKSCFLTLRINMMNSLKWYSMLSEILSVKKQNHGKGLVLKKTFYESISPAVKDLRGIKFLRLLLPYVQRTLF